MKDEIMHLRNLITPIGLFQLERFLARAKFTFFPVDLFRMQSSKEFVFTEIF